MAPAGKPFFLLKSQLFYLQPHSFGFQIEALKSITKSDLVSWYQTHRSSMKKVLSVHVSSSSQLSGATGEMPHLVTSEISVRLCGRRSNGLIW